MVIACDAAVVGVLNEQVAPVGRPDEQLKVGVLTNGLPSEVVSCMVAVDVCPGSGAADCAVMEMAMFCAMVSDKVVVSVTPPLTPDIVTVAAPDAAVALAVSVSVLVVEAGFGLKFAVTPAGKLVAVSVTLPVNPVASVTVTALVPVVPWATGPLSADAESVNGAVTVTVTVVE
jgi:hypothetical protein